MDGVQVITQDFINVHITKSDSEDAAPVERRFKKGITVLEFKVHTHFIFLSKFMDSIVIFLSVFI